MQNYLNINEQQMQAQTLTDNGYKIVPIPAGTKGPMVKSWQSVEFTASDITAGIGIKCGQGDYPICAIDIDVLDDEIAASIVDYCQTYLGTTVERVGRAPKILLPYRAAETGWAKRSSPKYGPDKYQVEILGKGQQFVAYAIHPDTQQPYEWVDFLGGLDAIPAADLPVVSQADIDALLQYVDSLMRHHGLQAAEKPTSTAPLQHIPDDFTADQPIGLTVEQAKDYLQHLDAADYELWVKIGMALKHEFGADGLALWDDWSATAVNYAGHTAIAAKFESFNRGGITAKTLVKLGNEANAQAEIELKKAVINEYAAMVNDADDVVALEKIARKIGTELSSHDVAIVESVHRAVTKRWAALSGATPRKEMVNKILNVQASFGFEDLKSQSAFTEFGNAARFVKEHGDDVMYIAETDTWYLWTNTHWRKGTSTEVEFLAKQTVNSLLLDCKDMDSVGANMADFIRESLNARMVNNIVKLARVEPKINVPFSHLDKNSNLLGVGNGTVDLTTGQLYPADPDDRITVATGVAFVQCPCPVWMQTLHEIFDNDDELIEYVQTLIGYALLGNPVQSLFVILYGDGSNGKSTFINTIREVVGQHAKVANSETFLGTAANNSGGPREDILRLTGSRIVTVTEPDEGGVLKEGLIKAMTGGEALPARAAYGRNTVEVKPTWTTFMPTNHKPVIKGTDHGIWRRLVLIPFPVNFDKHPTIKKDPYRTEKLRAEYSGILAWIVEGALRYAHEGLKMPAVVEAARAEYKEDMDLINDWLNECCVIGPNEIATNRELWASWEGYAKVIGELKYISSSRTLAKRLSTKFQPAKNIGKEYLRGFKGLSVKNCKDFDEV